MGNRGKWSQVQNFGSLGVFFRGRTTYTILTSRFSRYPCSNPLSSTRLVIRLSLRIGHEPTACRSLDVTQHSFPRHVLVIRYGHTGMSLRNAQSVDGRETSHQASSDSQNLNCK
jgi:hypothetical protein